MAVLEELALLFSVETDASKLVKLDDSIDRTLQKANQLGQALLGGAAVRGLANFVDSIRQAGNELDIASARFGMPAQAVQEWRYAGSQFGVSVEHMNISFATLERNAEAAGRGVTDQAQMFRVLGVQVKDSAGQLRTLDDIVPELSEGLSKIESPTQRAGLAMRLFGEHGGRLLPLLERGPEGLAQFREEFHRLGGGMSDQAIKAAERYTGEVKDLEVAWTGAKSVLAVQVFPILRAVTEKVTEALVAVDKAAEKTQLWRAASITLSGALAVWSARLLALNPTIALAAIAIGTVVGAVEELDSLITGKARTATEELGDEIFGVGETARFASRTVNELRLAYAQFMDDVEAGNFGDLFGLRALDQGIDSLTGGVFGLSDRAPAANTRRKAVETSIEEERQMGGAGRFGDTYSEGERLRFARGGRQYDPNAQEKALREHDAQAYQDARRGSQTDREAFDEYLQKSGDFEDLSDQKGPSTQAGRVQIKRKPSMDVGAVGARVDVGAIAPRAQVGPLAVQPSMGVGAVVGRPSLTIGGAVINVMVPPGSGLQDIELMTKRVVRDEMETRDRQIMEALSEESP